MRLLISIFLNLAAIWLAWLGTHGNVAATNLILFWVCGMVGRRDCPHVVDVSHGGDLRSETEGVMTSQRYHCYHCHFEGFCYGIPSSVGVGAPCCTRCGMNDKLVAIPSTP